MFESALVGVMIVVLFWMTYAVASAAMQLFTLANRTTPTPDKSTGRNGRLLDAFAKDPREVLLAAELFKSLMFLLIVPCGLGSAAVERESRLALVSIHARRIDRGLAVARGRR